MLTFFVVSTRTKLYVYSSTNYLGTMVIKEMDIFCMYSYFILIYVACLFSGNNIMRSYHYKIRDGNEKNVNVRTFDS